MSLAHLLGAVVDRVLARPRRVLTGVVASCLALAAVSLTVPADTSFLSVLNADDPLVQRYLAMDEATRLSHRAILLLEGDDGAVDEAASVAHAVLSGHAEVDWVALEPAKAAGARVLVVSLVDDPMRLAGKDIARGQTSFSLVEVAVAEALASREVSLGWAGVPAQTIQDIEATMGRMLWLTPLGFVAVLLLLRTVERRLVHLGVIGGALGLAALATVGLSALVFGSLTFNEGFLVVVVAGLGADFALHLVVRLREERDGGMDFDAALRRTLCGAGPAITAGALTTAGAFAVLALAPETLPRRMGVIGAGGMVLCLGVVLTGLPAAWVVLARRGGTAGPATGFRVPGVGALARAAAARPAHTLLLGLLLVVAAGSGVQHLRYETDFNNIVNRDVPAQAVNTRLQALFGTHSSPWLVASDTLPEARDVHQAFTVDPHFVRVDGAADWLPPGTLALPDDHPQALVAQLQTVDGRWLTWAYTDYAGLDTEQLRRDRLRAEAIAPEAAGYGLFVEAIVSPARPWAPRLGLGIAALVLVVLAVDLRSAKRVALAITPAGVGMVATLGLLGWLDVGLGIVHVVSVPLLLGLGVDDGLHVVHRLDEDPTLSADAAAVSVGRAIVVTTATTCASFAGLALSNNPSLEAMALVLLIGLPICLLASLTLVPAGAVLLRLRG